MLFQPPDSSQEGTRERILDAALDLFGERGLTGATVRDIAAAAKVNVAAVSYHFGGKTELYKAVATAIAGGLEARVRERAASVMEARPDGPQAAGEALEAMIEAVVDVIVAPPEMRRAARFILREQMQPTEAFEILYGTLSRLHGVACQLFAAATGADAEDADVKLRGFMIVGQVLVLRIAEAAVQRRLGIENYDEAFMVETRRVLKQNVRGMVAAAREGST